MQKILLVSILVVFVLGVSFLVIPAAEAMTPTLSVSASGTGDSVQVTINGDSNSAVYLYYQKINYGFQSQYIGTTNNYGYLYTTISTSSYDISSGASVYIMVNNQQSQSMAWPYSYNNYSSGSLSLSQTNITLNVGASQNVTIYGGSWPYTMNMSSSDIFQGVIGGNTLTIIGKSVGSGTLSVCSSGGGGCVTLYVTITSSSTNYGTISFSQNNISVNRGYSTTVTIYNNGGSYYNSYYVSNNSNSSIASANINGSTLTVYGNNYGSDSITVCQTGNQYSGQCGTLYVTVGYGGSSGYAGTAVTFSQSSLNLSIGQSTTVSISGGSGVNANYYSGNYYSGNYYIGYNSNSSSVQASLSGSTLTINGLADGAVAIVVCSAANNCGSLNVTVGSFGTVLGAQSNWTFCANENGYCSFSGTRNIRYGANGSYFYRTLTNGTTCSNSVFGDPLFGVVKQCNYSY